MAISLHAARLMFLLWLASKTQGMVCWMGKEPDPNVSHRLYRWVIPVEDPCKCTEVQPGGVNNRTPNRYFKVIYFDTFLMSNSSMEIRKWLHCPDRQDGINKSTLRQAPSTDKLSRTSAPGEPIDGLATTDAKTTAIPFTCVGKEDGNYADTTDCGKYYLCSNTIMFPVTCEAGTYFNSATGACGFISSDDCKL